MRPLVSILTPTYNHERFIGPCIESVLAQTYPNFEQIIIDDGSTDQTAQIAEGYPDPRIKVIRQENQGLEALAETYNTALAQAQGEFVAILEGDDLFPAEKLERQMAAFQDSAVTLCWGRLRTIDAIGNEIPIEPTLLDDRSRMNDPIGSAAIQMLRPSSLTFAFPVTVVMRRAALDSIGGFQKFPGLPVVDYPTFLAMALTGKWAHEPEVCGLWRRHGSSTTSACLSRILNGAYRCAAAFFNVRIAELPESEKWAAQLDSEWRAFQAFRATTLGRWKESEGKRSQAIELFRLAKRLTPSLKRRILLTAAIPLGHVGMANALHRLLGEPSWQEHSRIHGDLIIDPNDEAGDIVDEAFQARSGVDSN